MWAPISEPFSITQTARSLAATPQRRGPSQLALAEQRAAQPPLIPIEIDPVRATYLRCQRILDPGRRDDPVPVPFSAVQDELAELGHISRPQAKSGAGGRKPVRKSVPRCINNAERLEQHLARKVVDATIA